MRSLLAITSIHEFPSISIDFVLNFTQAYLDVDVFKELLLGMGFDVKILKWLLKLYKSIYILNQASENCFGLLKIV